MGSILVLGDCLENMKKMQSKTIDCIITDIPYFQVVDN